MTYDALTVAKYFLSKTGKDSDELVSNLKLQKLLYYAQGFYVALHGTSKPLFNETIYAWKHGPVVKEVYHHYSVSKNEGLPVSRRPVKISSADAKFLDEIYRVFGKFSAWALREMTHAESPWQDNYKPNVRDIEIPLVDLKKHFKNKYTTT